MDTEVSIETVPLRANVIRDKQGPTTVLYIGNTGLHFKIYGKEDRYWEQNFTPEAQVESVPGKELEYTLLYAYGLYHFALWWQNQGFDRLGLDKPKQIIGMTNPKMSNIRKKLLGERVYKVKEKVRVTGRKHDFEEGYSLDMDALISDDTKMEKLRLLSDRAQRQDYPIARR